MDSLLNDIRLAARGLVRARGFSAIAAITLTLGIGANVAMFTLVNTMLFRPPQVADPGRLVWITEMDGRGRHTGNLSYPGFLAYRTAGAFSAVSAYDNARLALGGETPERVRGALVSGNYFDVIGAPFAAGRGFRAEEDSVPLAHPVAVISHSLWDRRFGRNPRLVDSTIRVNGHLLTVVGIVAAGVRDLEVDSEQTEIWLPMAMMPIARPNEPGILASRNSGWLRILARLAPGVTRERAETEAAFAARDARDAEDSLDVRRAIVSPMNGALEPSSRRQVSPILGLVSLVPLLVLAVAGFNVVNLQLARGLSRRKEFAVRRALGAGRARIVRMLITESVLIAAIAGVASVWVSYALTFVISNVGDFPPFIRDLLVIDGRVVAVSAAVAFLAGLGVGVIPALVASGDALTPALKSDALTMRVGAGRHRLRDTFVVAQVAVSLVLIVTAGLFLRSLQKAVTVDVGFDAQGTVVASFDVHAQGYSAERRAAVQQRLLEEVQSLPQVTAAGITSAVPFGGRVFMTNAVDAAAAENERGSPTYIISASPGYLGAMGIELVRGRGVLPSDGAGTPPVVVVDEAVAAQLWPGQDPLGQRVRLSGNRPAYEVVGLARTAYLDDLTSRPVGTLYFAESQLPAQAAQSIVVRSSAPPAATIAGLRRVAASVDPDLPLFDVATNDVLMGRAVSGQRAVSAALTVFGGLALLLAGVGMFGVASHGVSTRIREIGIRMSLGARAGDVLRLVIGGVMGRAMIGVVVGLAISALLSRLLSGFLFGLSGMDLATFAAGAIILCGAAAIASLVPARRAVRVEPTVALKAE